MADAKLWVERIAAWRASGLTAKKFAEGKAFSAQQIWNWSWQLRRDQPRQSRRRSRPSTVSGTTCGTTRKDVRLARVVAVRPAVQSTIGLVVEVQGVRISVPIGFDRQTFSAVLDEVERRGLRGEPA
jgi:hypothetical protein